VCVFVCRRVGEAGKGDLRWLQPSLMTGEALRASVQHTLQNSSASLLHSMQGMHLSSLYTPRHLDVWLVR